jgi:hypothetical protein
MLMAGDFLLLLVLARVLVCHTGVLVEVMAA